MAISPVSVTGMETPISASCAAAHTDRHRKSHSGASSLNRDISDSSLVEDHLQDFPLAQDFKKHVQHGGIKLGAAAFP